MDVSSLVPAGFQGNQVDLCEIQAGYNKFSENLRKFTPQAIQCAIFCGGSRCKYENSKAWPPVHMAIQNIFSHWVTDEVLAMARPNTAQIIKKDIIAQFQGWSIKTIINLQTPGEHASCGGPLEESGFTYDPNVFMKHGSSMKACASGSQASSRGTSDDIGRLSDVFCTSPDTPSCDSVFPVLDDSCMDDVLGDGIHGQDLLDNDCYKEIQSHMSLKAAAQNTTLETVTTDEAIRVLIRDNAILPEKTKKRIQDYEMDLNHRSTAWQRLQMETDLDILSGLLFEWLETLKHPLLDVDSLSYIVVWSSKPERCLEKLPSCNRYLLEYILRFIIRLRPMTAENQSSITKRFIASLTQQTIWIKNAFYPSSKYYKETFSMCILHQTSENVYIYPHFTTSFSPFVVRIRPGRRREETGNKNLNMKNPSMTGQSSTSSTTSSASSSDDSSSDEDENHQHNNDSQLIISKENSEFTSFESLFPSMKEVYGTQPEYPKRNDVILYKRFALIGRNATYPSDYMKVRLKLTQQVSFPEAKIIVIQLPTVKKSNINIYEQYVKRAKVGGSLPNSNDINLYENYTKQQQLLKLIYPN